MDGNRRTGRSGALALALAVLACSPLPGTPPEQGLAYGELFGVAITTEPVATAVASASYHLRTPRALKGRPALAAQVAAQYEFAAAELEGIRFIGISPLTQILMREGRVELREILGVRAEAEPAAVVRSLVAAAAALGREDRAGAEAALQSRLFLKPAAEVLAALSDLPPAVRAGRAAAFAESQLNRPNGTHRRFPF